MKKRTCAQAQREAKLRAEFQWAAAAEAKLSAHVLRDLMDAYVEMQRNAAGLALKRQYGLERCAAALVACRNPQDAAMLVMNPPERWGRPKD